MKRFKATALLALIALGLAGSLTGCIIEEDGGRGGHWGHHYYRDWR
jgi:hypothetical protein